MRVTKDGFDAKGSLPSPPPNASLLTLPTRRQRQTALIWESRRLGGPSRGPFEAAEGSAGLHGSRLGLPTAWQGWTAPV
jgi:hypothetical protein